MNKLQTDKDVSMVEALQEMGEEQPLVKGRNIKCPHCELEADLLYYNQLKIVEKFAEFLVRPLKCRKCGFLFALKP